MTAPTPEQMRDLANRPWGPDHLNAVRAALRAAADRLEAVSSRSKLPFSLRRIASKQTSPADVHTLLLAADCLEMPSQADAARENALWLAAQLRDTTLLNLGRDDDGKNTITGKDLP